MRRDARHLVRILSLTIALVPFICAFVKAQDDPVSAEPGHFTCSQIDEICRPGQAHCRAQYSLARTETRPSATITAEKFGPFDEAQYGFSSIEVFSELKHPKDQAEENSLATETELELFVRTISASRDGWYLLEGSRDDLLADPASPAADDQTGTAGKPSEHQSSPAQVFAPGAGLPLLQASWESRWLGANAGGKFGRVVLLDFRMSTPAVLVGVSCVNGEGGGVCTAIDSGYGPSADLDCKWDSGQLDYACHERDNVGTGWGGRYAESESYLMSGKDAYVPPADKPASIRKFAEQLFPRNSANEKALIAEVGEVSAIYSIRSSDQAIIYLFAARGASSSLDARFFVAERPFTDRQGTDAEISQTAATTLQPVSYSDLSFQEEEKAHPKPHVSHREGGDALTFYLKKIHNEAGFVVIETTVKEGSHHAIYWIGIDSRGGKTVADAYRVATDANLYAGCNNFSAEPSATEYKLLPGSSFRAVLDEERGHTVSEEGYLIQDDSVPGTPTLSQQCSQQIAWDRSKGFILSENPTRCITGPPRSILISDDGKITSKPIEAAKPQ